MLIIVFQLFHNDTFDTSNSDCGANTWKDCEDDDDDDNGDDDGGGNTQEEEEEEGEDYWQLYHFAFDLENTELT